MAVRIFLCVSVLCFSFLVQAETSHFTRAWQLKSQKVIGDETYQFLLNPVHSASYSAASTETTLAPADSIEVGYPMDLIGESHMFGGVITKVSVKDNAKLGNLKLSSFTAAVKTEFVRTTEKTFMTVKGLVGQGHELKEPDTFAHIPIKRIENKTAFLDLSILGSEMDIFYIMTDGKKMPIQHLESKTTSVDFSLKTLVFEVESRYVAKPTETMMVPMTITTRWFMRLNSVMSPFFERRKNVPGVGFFTVGVNDGWISRYSIHDLKNNPIKYYIKNVPTEARRGILSAFEDWNHKLQNTLGQDLFSYEILEKQDPRYDQIVAGDVRYNVLEWDLDNVATYGAMGALLPNSISGEVMAGQVLIQGPVLLERYKRWFRYQEQGYQAQSNSALQIQQLLKNVFLSHLFTERKRLDVKEKAVVKLGKFPFKIPAQDPTLQDAAALDPLDYLETPYGYSYENYMNGFWRDLVAHEVGHTLGLRHNFKGSLADKGDGTVGSPSRSIMEYLPRTHRYLNRVGDYDVMAIAYGYLGVQPEHKDWYCTDEDQGILSYMKSAECSSQDATEDPVSFFEERIERGLDLLLNRETDEAPQWAFDSVWTEMQPFLQNLEAYMYTSSASADSWTNFFDRPDRPAKDGVTDYMIEKLNLLICGDLDQEVPKKSSPEAQAKTAEYLKAYRQKAFELISNHPSPWHILTTENFSCYKDPFSVTPEPDPTAPALTTEAPVH